MDRKTAKNIREELNSMDFSELEQKFGVAVSFGNCSYDSNSATFKLVLNNISEDGEVFDKAANAFKTQAKFYDLDPDDLGKEFVDKYQNNEVFRIVGLKPRAHKYPVILERVRDKKRFKYPAARVALIVNDSK